MSADTSVVVALLFVGFMVVAATVYSSYDYYKNVMKNAQYEQDAMEKNKMQTDITIINVTNRTTNLNLTIKNTGRTTLDLSSFDAFVDGNFYNYSLMGIGNILVPENISNISIPMSGSSGKRVKIVSENGISDYALVP